MKRILGIDFGDVRIGFAISDELLITAQSLLVYTRVGKKKDIEKIKSIVNENNVEKIVIGLPKNMDGSIGPQAEKVLKFEEILKSSMDNIKTIMWDERLTSKAAENVLIQGNVRRNKRKNVIDKLAAQIILQGYLDYLAHQSNLNE